MKKIIINLCPTGVIPTKTMNQYTPISPEEIVNDTKLAYMKGVQMVHIHARDNEGMNTMDKNRYAEIIEKIKINCPDIIICVSLTGRFLNTFEARSDVLNLKGIYKPHMGSLTLSSLNFTNNASVNTPEMIVKLLTKMNEENIKPELEVFDVGMINFSKYLIKKGLLHPPYYYNIILGNIFSAQNTPADISSLINALPPDSIFSIGGIGSQQLSSNITGIVYADGIRVGLEDNIYFDNNRTIMASNEMLLDRVIYISKMYERELYSCVELKKLLNITD
jgi:3-keto-5-aminohexanoate cleavage enzyme